MVGADSARLTALEIPYYTTANGTSFSAPQVAGAIALMLEANPGLTPAQVRNILQRTATPLTPYYQHETGAGMLNVHAAVLDASFPSRHIGSWRGTLDRSQVRMISDSPVQFLEQCCRVRLLRQLSQFPKGRLRPLFKSHGDLC